VRARGGVWLVEGHNHSHRQVEGISRKCVKTWIDRHTAEGERGLEDRSSRPRSCPTKTSTEVETQIVKLRRCERRGPDWLGAELGVPTRADSRVLARHPGARGYVRWIRSRGS
jgi:leucine-zipper of insertion element IS481